MFEESNDDIKEMNMTIALFDGAIMKNGFCFFENGDLDFHLSRYQAPNHLQYHASFDWLMPVIEKIESGIDKYVTVVYERYGKDDKANIHIRCDNIFHTYQRGEKENKIRAFHKAVYEFIKWYNDQSKK